MKMYTYLSSFYNIKMMYSTLLVELRIYCAPYRGVRCHHTKKWCPGYDTIHLRVRLHFLRTGESGGPFYCYYSVSDRWCLNRYYVSNRYVLKLLVFNKNT